MSAHQQFEFHAYKCNFLANAMASRIRTVALAWSIMSSVPTHLLFSG